MVDAVNGQSTEHRLIRSPQRPSARDRGVGHVRTGLATRFADWLWEWRSYAPETLEMAMARLASTSHHLLDDIGVHVVPADRLDHHRGAKPVVVVQVLQQPDAPESRLATGPNVAAE
jgi:hypothetical protein